MKFTFCPISIGTLPYTEKKSYYDKIATLISWLQWIFKKVTIIILLVSFSNISVYASILIKLPEFSNRKKLEFAILASSLRGRHFFHVNPWHRVPPRITISISKAIAVANPESHAHSAFVDVLTDSFDMTRAVQIFCTCSLLHVDHGISSCWSRAFCAIKGEIPSLATVVAVIDPKLATEVDTQTWVVWRFLKNTFLFERRGNNIYVYTMKFVD